MSLLNDWREYAYSFDDKTPEGRKFWVTYFQKEKEIYEKLLNNPKEKVVGTVKELSEKYEVSLQTMVGFLDGIEESLINPNNVEEITEESQVSLDFDLEKLYMNMVGCSAEWLYTLPQWEILLADEKRKELYKKEKSSKTIVKAEK